MASIGAPKPMYFLDGEQDQLSQRAQNRLRTEIWPGLRHVFVREMQDAAYALLDSRMARPRRGHD